MEVPELQYNTSLSAKTMLYRLVMFLKAVHKPLVPIGYAQQSRDQRDSSKRHSHLSRERRGMLIFQLQFRLQERNNTQQPCSLSCLETPYCMCTTSPFVACAVSEHTYGKPVQDQLKGIGPTSAINQERIVKKVCPCQNVEI